MYGAGDVRFELVEDPKIVKPTDAIIKLSATCICRPEPAQLGTLRIQIKTGKTEHHSPCGSLPPDAAAYCATVNGEA